MNIGRVVNGPKRTFFDEILCAIGIHTYHSVYVCYDDAYPEYEGKSFNVCTCGHCRKFGEKVPLIYRVTGVTNPDVKFWGVGF